MTRRIWKFVSKNVEVPRYEIWATRIAALVLVTLTIATAVVGDAFNPRIVVKCDSGSVKRFMAQPGRHYTISCKRPEAPR